MLFFCSHRYNFLQTLIILFTIYQGAFAAQCSCQNYNDLYVEANHNFQSNKKELALQQLKILLDQVDKSNCIASYFDALMLKLQIVSSQGDRECEGQLLQATRTELDFNKKGLIHYYDKLNADLLARQARFEYYESDLITARVNFERALSIYKELEFEDKTEKSKNVKSMCLWIAECYKNQGSYKESIDYYLKSLEFQRQYRDTNSCLDYFNTYKLIARSYNLCGQTDLALANFSKAVKEFDKVKYCAEEHSNIHQKARRLFQDLAGFYIQLEMPDSSLYYLKRSEEFNKSFRFIDITEITKGKAHAQLNNNEKALKHYNRALSLIYGSQGAKSNQAGKINRLIGDLFEKNNDHLRALNHYQAALANLIRNFEKTEYHYNPSVIDDSTVDKHELLNVLFNKGRSLFQVYRNDTTQAQNIKLALETNQIASDLIDKIKLDHITDYDKEVLAQKSFQIYEQGIELCHLLSQLAPSQNQQYIAKAFQLSERAKATTLIEGIKKQSQFSNVPKEVILKEKQLDGEILSLEAALSELKEVDGTSARKAISNSLGNLRKEKRIFLEKVKRSYPGYYTQRVDKQVCTTEEVQRQLLDDESAMIEYFMGDQALYIFCITHDKVQIFRRESPTTILDSFKSFEAIISDVTTFKDTCNLPNFRRISVTLQDFLLKDVLSPLSKKIKRLVVIRDGVFSNFPFELFYDSDLSANQNDEHQNKLLLLNHFAFSYPYSATILKMQQENHLASTSNNFFLGFAPAYDIQNTTTKKHTALLAYIPNVLRSGLLGLAGARREVEQIKKITSGHAVIGSSATKSFLLDNLKEYDILHLSMHYIKDDQNPLNAYLPFENHSKSDSIEKLHTHELYSTTVDAKMVVLSACNTGDGPLQKGEGVKSLSRAFTYAGASSTLMSLWKAPDAFTQFIMTSFYENLKEGLKKDEALRQAKLNFIAQYPKYNHPFYWAGFVATGDMSAIEFPGTQFDLFSFVFVAGLLVMLCAIMVKSPVVNIRGMTRPAESTF